MRLWALSFLFLITLASCKKKTDINEVFSGNSNWEVLSISIYDGFIGDVLNSSVIQHHKNVGELTLSAGGIGVYTFNSKTTPVSWDFVGGVETGSLTISLDVDEPSKLESYFVFYQVGGFLGDFRNSENTYEVNLINENMVQLRYLPEFYSSAGTYSTEIILGKIGN